MKHSWKEHSILPGFLPSLGLTLFYLTLVVLLPVSTLFVNSATIGFQEIPCFKVVNGRKTGELQSLPAVFVGDHAVAKSDVRLDAPSVRISVDGTEKEVPPSEVEYIEAPLKTRLWNGLRLGVPAFWKMVTSPRVLASFRVTFGTALAAAFLNLFLGGILAYALVRIRLPFKRVIDALVDLPFAMPTAICGIAMATLYAPKGPVGALAEKFGLKIAFTPLGITLAMIFIGMPFVVRALQPALEDLGHELEDAAMSLGATRIQAWRKVIVPTLAPALLTGFTLAFARGLGEYGTIIFIAGNTPMKTEVTSLLIVTQLEQFNYPGATAIAVTMLVISLVLIFGINWFFNRKHHTAGA